MGIYHYERAIRTISALLAIYLAAGALAAACSDSQTNCAEGQCDTVGGTEICTQCKQSFVPINGACVEAAANNDKCKDTDGNADADQTCKVCLLQTFMYKGGCYEGSNEIGQIICEAIGNEVGKCQSCKAANGFFRNPEAANNVDSCISCGDTTGVTVGNGGSAKTYKGVDGCKTCTLSNSTTIATCTECSTDLYLKTETSGTSCVASNACTGDFFPMTDTADSNKKKCLACSDENCKTCSGAATACTSCKDTGMIYLKKEADSDTGTCVDKTGCTDGNYIDEEAKTCSTCASAGTTDCKTCAKTDGVVACASCEANQKFGLNKKSCVKDCPTSSQAGSDSVCVCNDGFTPSTDSTACVAASSGPNLSTGAIAGISVAAVVVVGGLVGFLCWWFICRGKA
ncbi:Variant-specific surface protein [Giardia duodenalis]|uniref:Variant-specific surface protein n=1 Tax=Giardia intestinalis TaxID=5741 RepID=V6U1G3_GIAIN|nr:Variant-specific surface protein [Giardia intestinalis]